MKGDGRERAVGAADAVRTYRVVAGRAGRRGETAVRRGAVEVSEVTDTGEKPARSGHPLREDPETWDPVSNQGSTPHLVAHPPGGPAIGTRA
ncbi:hypothetical protein [Streptomyces sp. DSM 15324]|uniref:hypothetical protein n=1 Tax=Streptomyces sp. DSM 15324 TaxID=1739111 RepID=UPI00099E1B63|nr:hypothetical protein [Streptomyces sp. DSM 15324]